LAEIKRFEEIGEKRLADLGLTFKDLDNLETLEIYKDGEYRGHELYDLQNLFIGTYLLREDLRAGRIASLFKNAVFLGELLPKGSHDPNEPTKIKWTGRHPYDVWRNSRKIRKKTGGQREDLKQLDEVYKPFILDRAKEIYRENPTRPLTTNKTSGALSVSEQISLDLKEAYPPKDDNKDVVSIGKICELIRNAELNKKKRGRPKTK
jgi:hypothetical protein